MPLLGRQPEVSDFLSRYASTLATPTAIVVITAHWIEESDAIAVSAADSYASLLFDYGGFPPETYKYKYAAPGSPKVAEQICELLRADGIVCRKDTKRGWDHGVFVPLMLLYPKAEIPVVAMSLHHSLDPEYHLRIGKAISSLRDSGVLIIGSGASFHNFDYFFTSDANKRNEGIKHSHVFNDYISDTLTSGKYSTEEQIEKLKRIYEAPSARICNKPREEEHLIPLLVIAGAGLASASSSNVETCRTVGPSFDYNNFAVANLEWK